MLRSVKPCLLALFDGSCRPGFKGAIFILRTTLPTELFYLKIAPVYISTRQEELMQHFQTSFVTALSHTLSDGRYGDVLLSVF